MSALFKAAKVKGILRDVDVHEISLVDRPANKRRFLIIKRDSMSKTTSDNNGGADPASDPATGNPATGEGAGSGAGEAGASGGDPAATNTPAAAQGAVPAATGSEPDITQVVKAAVAAELKPLQATLSEILATVTKAAAPPPAAAPDVAALEKRASAAEAEAKTLREKVAKQAQVIAAQKFDGVGHAAPPEKTGGGGGEGSFKWPSTITADASGRRS